MNQKKEGFFEKILNWLKSLFFKRELEFAIIGLQNAGKTTLVEFLTSGKFDEDTIPTVGFNYKQLVKGKVMLKIWDLGNFTINQ